MANLKDTIVLGNLTVTGVVTASDLLVSGGSFLTTNTTQTITGTKTFDAPIKTTANCLGGAGTALRFVVGISAFDQGGQMYWQEAEKFVYNNIPKVGVGATSTMNCGWTNTDAASALIPTMNFMAYWNGAYDSANHSNLTYCSKGTIVGGSGSVTKVEKVTSLPSSPDATTVYFITG